MTNKKPFLESTKTQNIIGITNLGVSINTNKKVRELKKKQNEANKILKQQEINQKEANRLAKEQAEEQISNQKEANRIARKQAEEEARNQKISNELIKKQILADKEHKEKIIKEKKLNQTKKQVVMNARKGLETTMNSNKTHMEKYFTFNSYSKQLKDSKIKELDFDSFSDKEYFLNVKNNIKQAIKESYSMLSLEEKKDVKIINKILAVDEEKKISTLTEKLEKIENRIKFWDQTIKTVDSSTSLSYLDSIIVKYNIQET